MASKLTDGVFNVTGSTYWMTQGLSDGLYGDGTHATQNATLLNAMINLLLTSTGPTNGFGGTLEFPSGGTFAFSGSIIVGTGPANTPCTIIFKGDGECSRANPILEQNNGSDDFFQITNNVPMTDDSIVGVVFQDLMLHYPSGSSGSAVHVQAGQNVRLYRVTLYDCPIGFYLENSLHCSMIDCNVRMVNFSGGIAVQLGPSGSNSQAIETYIAGCSLFCAAASGTALQIYGSEHLRVVNTRLDGWTNGILITPQMTQNNTGPVQQTYFGNVSCYSSGAAVKIQPTGGTAQQLIWVAQVWFAQCEFGPGGGNPENTDPGILIGQTDAYNVVDQVRFVDCFSCMWGGPGLLIKGGTNIEVIGGYYSYNGLVADPATPYQQSGIVLTGSGTGPVTGVRINGAACNNALFSTYKPYGYLTGNPQSHGVYVTNNVQNVRIHDCDLTGNASNGLAVAAGSGTLSNIFVKNCDFTGLSTPVNVITPVSNLQIVDCPGYNDQNTPITPSSWTGGLVSAQGLGYYGPSVLTWSVGTGPVTFTLNTTSYSSTFGSVYLSPFDEIKFSAAPLHVTWVLK